VKGSEPEGCGAPARDEVESVGGGEGVTDHKHRRVVPQAPDATHEPGDVSGHVSAVSAGGSSSSPSSV
jgi:hypothetical protein